jgi:homoserine kinase
MVKSVTVQVPATTSNLGPGFDCLGIALRLYNWVTVRRLDRRERAAEHPMAAEAAARFFAANSQRSFAFGWEIAGDLPVSRGLGSSVTLRLGILAGLNELAGGPLKRTRLFELCAELEGHPDNAAPATFGGFTVCDPKGAPPLRVTVDAKLQFVLLVPDFEVRTAGARSILPATIPRLAAVASAGRACRIATAFATRRYSYLRGMFADEAFHQPHRAALVPFLPRVLTAAEKAGALGAFLSGSGSTICAVALNSAGRVGAAMRRAAGVGSAQIVSTRADNRGYQIL